MGRKKSPVTRKRAGRRYVDSAPSGSSSLSASDMSDLLADVSPSSLRGLAAVKQEPDAMDTESSDSPRLPRAAFRGANTPLPIGGEARGRRQNGRRKRRSSSDDVRARKRAESEGSSDEDEEEEEKEDIVEMVTISVAELEKWQQRVIFHVEDHFTNEQLKRIAEFGRVHGSIVQEAREYVGQMEMQLKNQLEEERASLRTQAEEFVAAENESLRKRVEGLEKQVEGLEKQVDTLDKEVDTLEKRVDTLEKQVDTLEQEVSTLKVENAQSTHQREEERQLCREQLQQTHSPPNQQTQVQPGQRDEEMDGNAHSHSADENHNTSRYGLTDSGSADQPNAAKPQTTGGPTNQGSEPKTTTSTLRPDSHPDYHLQPPAPSAYNGPPPNGTQPKLELGDLHGLQTTTSAGTSSELRQAGGTG